jgi:hypothetical protein
MPYFKEFIQSNQLCIETTIFKKGKIIIIKTSSTNSSMDNQKSKRSMEFILQSHESMEEAS